MTSVRGEHTATLLSNGKVLVVGGVNNGLNQLSSAELYDPAEETWSPTASMNVARRQHTAILLPDGEVLVAGGISSSFAPASSAEIYDPESNPGR